MDQEQQPAAAVEHHYGRGRILDSILASLQAMGHDIDHLAPADLAAVDEFHIRGREATAELARRAAIDPGWHVLEVGSGLGGSSRFLAAEYGCRVTGIDLTAEYVEVANALAHRVGLGDRTTFQQANALAIPFPDASFDMAWTQHVQMNIADKARFYGEIARVLRPGGVLLFHDIFEGDGSPLRFPVPWAEEASISFLATPSEARRLLEEAGFVLRDWVDMTAVSVEWQVAAAGRPAPSGRTPLGTHLLMGETAKTKLTNVLESLRDGRLAVYQACAERQ